MGESDCERKGSNGGRGVDQPHVDRTRSIDSCRDK